ncbi:MAG TPA: hypothetical protein VFE69_11070, partial [Ilumatobacteraceae bacterium]|nr:hypothetical protein [Ilumatobacteraceae bacterium]
MPTAGLDQISGAISKVQSVLDSEAAGLNIETAEDHRCIADATGDCQGKARRLEGLPCLLPVAGLEQSNERIVATGGSVR